VDGVVDMVLDATQRHQEPLTAERLFGWHAALFPTGYSGLTKIRIGQWRDDMQGPMQVVSGAIHRQKVHYEAPPAHLLDAEMMGFLKWFNGEQHDDPVIKAGLAHLWFVTIHPFEDGNGRIARAVGDMALARADESTQRYYSLSAQIQRERNDYYDGFKPRKEVTWMSPIGCNGFWPVCCERCKGLKKHWHRCWARQGSGSTGQVCR
jgi:Fic family protein